MTPGGEQNFSNINTLAVFASPTSTDSVQGHVGTYIERMREPERAMFWLVSVYLPQLLNSTAINDQFCSIYAIITRRSKMPTTNIILLDN